MAKKGFVCVTSKIICESKAKAHQYFLDKRFETLIVISKRICSFSAFQLFIRKDFSINSNS
jgi:hypothetical protein